MVSSSSRLRKPCSSSSTPYSPSKWNLRQATARRISLAVVENTCPICLCRVDARRAAVIDPCFHAYCHGCLLRWSTCKRTCPLCNAGFDSYLSNVSGRTFEKHRLPPPPSSSSSSVSILAARTGGSDSGRIYHRLADRRIIRRANWERRNRTRSRSHQHSHRSFGAATETNNPASSINQANSDRVLQWRASIYTQRLKAVPLKRRSCSHNHNQRNGLGLGLTTAEKERILRRIEPWIRRELRAILNDPDPTVIVHVAASLFITDVEMKSRRRIFESCAQEDVLAPLRRFLCERTDMFWHELRCFVESGYSVDSYDRIAEYKPFEA